MPLRIEAGPILLSLAQGVPMALFNPPAAHLWLHKAPVLAQRLGRSRLGMGEGRGRRPDPRASSGAGPGLGTRPRQCEDRAHHA